ncbi:MAG: hypothetical protein LUG93_13835 [Lachnospiraceae bacterium]|nr:hypothetical protein [Lachnospiraceae bacterium]
MEYFYKLEEQGEAVIIRLEPEQLLSLDPSELDRRKADANGEISEEEVMQWLQQHSSELRQKYEENEAVMQENRQLREGLEGNKKTNVDIDREKTAFGRNVFITGKGGKQTLTRRLQEVRLNEEQTKIIDYAIRKGMGEEQLLILLRDEWTTDEMRKLCEMFLQETHG